MKALVTALFLGGLVVGVYLIGRASEEGGHLRPAAAHTIHALFAHLGPSSHN
jgi:hypothetical protein